MATTSVDELLERARVLSPDDRARLARALIRLVHADDESPNPEGRAEQDRRAKNLRATMTAIQERAVATGLDKTSNEEIDAEIEAVRKKRIGQ